MFLTVTDIRPEAGRTTEVQRCCSSTCAIPPNNLSRAVDHVKSQGVRLVLEKDIAHRVSLQQSLSDFPQIYISLLPPSVQIHFSLRFSTYLVRSFMSGTLWNKRAGRRVFKINLLLDVLKSKLFLTELPHQNGEFFLTSFNFGNLNSHDSFEVMEGIICKVFNIVC